MKVEFLGAGSCLPERAEADTASLLIDGHILVDTGWLTLRNLLRTGRLPHDIDTIFFTHMHQDHYMGLVQFLFYLENGDGSFGNLKIYGPEGLEQILRLALTYTGFERYYQEQCGMPYFRQLQDGETVICPAVSEDQPEIKVNLTASHHAVPGFSYRFTSTNAQGNEVSVTYSGDTAFYPEIIPLAKGSDVLIHEAAFGPKEAPEYNPYGHASCMDAARVAKAAGVKALYMVHCAEASTPEILEKSGEIFQPVYRPMERDVIEL